MNRITRTWALLVIFSVTSTALAAAGTNGAVFMLCVLGLSGLKARLILADYLGLSAAPGWQRGFDLALALIVMLFATLALAA